MQRDIQRLEAVVTKVVEPTQILRQACKFGHRQQAFIALKSGADYNYVDRHGFCAEDYCLANGDDEMYRLIKSWRVNHSEIHEFEVEYPVWTPPA